VSSSPLTPSNEGIAIIGMAGRFPGARNVAEFWRNQLAGAETISRFKVEDLEVAEADELTKNPNYVLARSILEDIELFDADFFGLHPREAELMDPQHRIFLECCWQALEDGGYDPFSCAASIGIYAGTSIPSYFLSTLCQNKGFISNFTSGYQVGNYLEMLGNGADFLATRVSYKLNLRGPAVTLQTACSTSLVAVCQASQSLLTYECDMALAGGVSISLPQKRGYLYQEGGMVSPDGHCRAFDADAQGTVFGSGVGVVLLKRIEDALRDGDQIYAVIRGFAVNNDGSSKVGYTAPSVEGQARVISLAQQMAGIGPDSIGYIEAHGTGTPLGDPIELTALTEAFRAHTNAKQFCAIGTAKTNVGHLDVAAGITGLIHAAHVVRDGVLPATLHFRKPNPKFDLENSPFYVNSKRHQWKASGTPRRAGVSSFGVGGTNAHAILEQSPPIPSDPPSRTLQLLLLSARSEAALERAAHDLAEHLRSNPAVELADVAWTLQVGRRQFPYRRTVVARDVPDAIEALSASQTKRAQQVIPKSEQPSVHFLFPGQGSQRVGMGRAIYKSESVFRAAVDLCADIARQHLGFDLREKLYGAGDSSGEAAGQVTDTLIAQPAIFTIEYALAQLWMRWGIRPAAMLGHSVGEFVAACLANVFSLEEALALIAVRAQMMQALPRGGMLAVRLSEAEVTSRLNGNGLCLAAVNAPSLCVVAGTLEALDEFEAQLAADGTPSRRLPTSHAFHSPMMDPVLERFGARVAQVHLNSPQIPFISGTTGTWIADEQATDPRYWARHLRAPVRFSAGISKLLNDPNSLFLEVGPGDVLSNLVRRNVTVSGKQAVTEPIVISSLGDPSSEIGEAQVMKALGSLWRAGIQPDWKAFHNGERRLRVSLPTYPFERKRYWLDSPCNAEAISDTTPKPAQPAKKEPTILEDTRDVNVNSQAASIPQAPNGVDRAARISGMLTDIFHDLSGTEIPGSNASMTFLELGFDSLFLTQVAQALQSKFKLKITFRQLLSELSSLNSLAEYIDRQLPVDVLRESPSAVSASIPTSDGAVNAALCSATPTPAQNSSATAAPNGAVVACESAIERLMRDQLQALNQLVTTQLESLKAASLAAGSAPSPKQSKISVPPVSEATLVTSSSAPIRSSEQENLASSTAPKKQEFTPFGPYKPPQNNPDGELSDDQQEYLRSFIRRYTERTAGSKRLTQQYRSPLADPRVVSGFRAHWKEIVYPIVTARSKGSRLWDVDGNEYIDMLNGFGPILFGHRPDFIEKAIEQQLHEGFEIGPQTPLAGEIAAAFCEMTGNERMTFCNTGSEAVIAALRVARTVTGRSKVVLFAGSYHGMFDEVLVKNVGRAADRRSLPIAPGIPRESVANIIVLDYGTAESLEWIRLHVNELAAVLVEPVQSRHPNLQPREFLRELRSVTQQGATALIFDEVVTGFRVHPGGCQALFDIRADLATYGKVLGGGMPIGVLAGKSEFMDALDGGAWQFGDDSYPSAGVTFFAGTFVRHPLTLAAVRAVLTHLKEQGPQLQERLNTRTAAMVQSLNDIFERNHVPTRIETFGSISYFSFPHDFPLGSLLHYHLRAKGVYLLEGFPCFLTTAHNEADIERVIQAFRESVAELQIGGIFPKVPAETRTRDIPQAITVPVRPHETAPESDVTDTSPAEVPLTEAQLEVWLSALMSQEASCAYNESFTLHLRGALSCEVLRRSLQQIVNRHESLRATIDPERHVLQFANRLELQIPFEDLSGRSEPERESRLQGIKQEEAQNAFDLSKGPLVRARLVKLQSQYHALIFTAHHLVCDGWSTNILLGELGTLYSAYLRDAEPQLPKPLQFREYARQQLKDAGSDEASSYWLNCFAHQAPVLELPTDRPRPDIKSFKGSTYRMQINLDTYKEIKQAGARQGCTLFATLLSGFATLLHRLTGQNDLVIGIPTAGQSLLDNGNLVGHCVNFLPLRIQFIRNQFADELLQNVKRVLLEAYEHQNYTYGTLVRKLNLHRDPSRLPLVEVQFNLEKIGTDLHLPGLQAAVDPNPKSAVNFDLFLNVVESDKGLLIDCDYNSELFDRGTIARWLTHFETLLKGIAANPARAVDHLPLLNDSEQRRMLIEWNATDAEYPREKCVHHLVEEQIQRTPDDIAVTFQNQSLTYAQLDSRANQLAHHLIKIGVTPRSLVGVSMDRSLEMLVALLAIWKAGAAYVPLDPTYPSERLSFILDDTALSVVITHSKIVGRLPAFDARLICVDRDAVLIKRELETSPGLTLESGNPAYVIYTSGSTGKPKGVEVSHRNVVNLLCSMQQIPGLTQRDRLLAVTTLSFDIAGLELFLPLITGAQVILCTKENSMDGRLLRQLLKETATTVMQATPATWRLLLEAGWPKDSGLKILCGGEALPRELANELISHGEVWNMYGPTETTIWSSASCVEPGDAPITLGPPIRNTQFYVLDQNLQPLPIGIAGELYIGGDGVATGYHKNAALTEQRFIRDPFRPSGGARLYRTGDLVRYRLDGRLEFLGRLDNQVKIRGFRIELGEIESVLSRHPAIRESAVVPQESEPGLKRLVAFLVSDLAEKPASEELRRWVGGQLPDYMVPSIFTFLPALPQTPNGKVDRKALAATNARTVFNPKMFVPPRTLVEQQLADICCEVLHLERISANDNLFDLGADSLQILQIVSRANRAGLRATPQHVLRLRTIGGLAAELDANTGAKREMEVDAGPITPVPRERYQLRQQQAI
jgi:amino acid adenylation domain-containing protein